MPSYSGIRSKAVDLWHLIIKEIAKFGVVGAVAYVVDNFAFAYLLYGMPGPGNGPLFGHHKISSALATTIATLVSWLGNRYWTFRHKRNVNRGRELLLFGFFNVVGLAITMLCVIIAVDLLHLRGLGWETTARNVGIVLGTLFRFWTYRSFVFRRELDEDFGALESGPTPPPGSSPSGQTGDLPKPVEVASGPAEAARSAPGESQPGAQPGDAPRGTVAGMNGRRFSRAANGSRPRIRRDIRRRPAAVGQARDDSSASERNRAKSTG